MYATNRLLAISMSVFSGLMLSAYFGLVSYFQFPEVLRFPTTELMELFVVNQSKIVSFYYRELKLISSKNQHSNKGKVFAHLIFHSATG